MKKKEEPVNAEASHFVACALAFAFQEMVLKVAYTLGVEEPIRNCLWIGYS